MVHFICQLQCKKIYLIKCIPQCIRSGCASEQSDQSLCCAAVEVHGSNPFCYIVTHLDLETSILDVSVCSEMDLFKLYNKLGKKLVSRYLG